jgi:hypothetical protein
MEHLNLEILARLIDERPNPKEREHLASCTVCASELRALKMQTEALSGLPVMRPPHGDWQALEARLLSEGLLHTSSQTRLPFLQRIPAWTQVAAALVIFVGGAGAGASFTDRGGAELGRGSLAEAVTGVDDALQLVEATERDYMAALVRYNQLSRAGIEMTEDEIYQRLAAYEGLLTATQQAVQMAPADPVFNGLLANVVAERQSALRMVSASNGNF